MAKKPKLSSRGGATSPFAGSGTGVPASGSPGTRGNRKKAASKASKRSATSATSPAMAFENANAKSKPKGSRGATSPAMAFANAKTPSKTGKAGAPIKGKKAPDPGGKYYAKVRERAAARELLASRIRVAPQKDIRSGKGSFAQRNPFGPLGGRSPRPGQMDNYAL